MEMRHNFDAAVVGAGPAGLAAALGLHAAGLAVAVAETAPEMSARAAAGRTAALMETSVAFLRGLGVWARCEAFAAPLCALQFIDDTGRVFRAPDVAFRAGEIGLPAFGYNVANADLARELTAAARERGIAIAETGALAGFTADDHGADLDFAGGARWRARLAVAADGRNSALRSAAGIRTVAWAYDQMAVATSFAHSRPHHGVCIELHRAGGPFTLVPLPGERSSLVWVERKGEAQRLMALDDAAFAAEVEAVSRGRLGRVYKVAPRAGFPLSSLAARDYARARTVLAGEAAHVTPPIGAQGLNLGFRDVAEIVRLAGVARAEGRDIGGADVLAAYTAARRGDIVSRTFGVDILNRSLLSGFLPLQLGRGAGLYALAQWGPLRRAFMRRGIAPEPRAAGG